MKSVQKMLDVYNTKKTFVSLLDEAKGNFRNPEELTKLSVDKIIGYVRDFCSKVENNYAMSHLRKLQYICIVTNDCFRKRYIKKKLENTVLEPINRALYDLEEGRMTPLEAADVLKEEILNSKYLEKYDAMKRYIFKTKRN